MFKIGEYTKIEVCLLWNDKTRSVVWGTGTPKDRDEVNKQEVYECDE